MAQLAIKVRGKVLSSNFDEWKLELIAQIQSVNTELATDAQFAQAQTDIKNFKSAEKTLKQAKQSAISQASEIDRLFSAIDEVSGEVRQVRLTLERQIKQRKLEIKDEFVDLGIDNIKQYSALQGPEFQIIDHSDYLDRGFLKEVLKYKSTIKALHGAIDDACGRIKTQIDERVAMVNQNAMNLDSLPVAHQTLFQDRSELLALAPSQLDDVIDKRIAVFEQQTKGASSEQSVEPSVPGDTEVGTNIEIETRKPYALTIELLATPTEADAFFESLRSVYSGNPLVRTFQLEEA